MFVSYRVFVSYWVILAVSHASHLVPTDKNLNQTAFVFCVWLWLEAVMSYQNKVDTPPLRGSYGVWQVSTCNPYCSHGGLVLLHSLSLRESVHFIVGFEVTI
ncbi:hypothetical protein HanIR_Chr05g0219181 [Helianthus annuus]|nr:hypothetical protein HanIR_Chr05g0219181 [Helianthus annuus]